MSSLLGACLNNDSTEHAWLATFVALTPAVRGEHKKSAEVLAVFELEKTQLTIDPSIPNGQGVVTIYIPHTHSKPNFQDLLPL